MHSVLYTALWYSYILRIALKCEEILTRTQLILYITEKSNADHS